MKLLKHFNFVFCLILLFGFYFYTAEYLPRKMYPEYVNKTLYLDRSFNAEERQAIIEATFEWAEVTDYRVCFKVADLPMSVEDSANAIIVNKLDDQTAQVVMMDLFSENITLGFYETRGSIPYIGMISYRISSKLYKPVFLHELGHALGLNHNEKDSDKGTLMYPIIDYGSDHVTEIDVANYCKLHHCTSKH